MSTANVTQTGQSSTVTVTVSRGLQGIPGSDATVTTEAVESAGALMDSEVENLEDLKAFDPADYAPALGADDNYVTDAEKTVIGNTSGTNTGDQDLSGLATQSDLTAETAEREAATSAATGHIATAMPKLSAGLEASPKTATIMLVGDSFSTGSAYGIDDVLENNFGAVRGFSLNWIPATVAGGAINHKTSNGNLDFDIWINGCYVELGAGSATYLASTVNRITSDTLKLFYIAEPGAGTFDVEVDSGSGYVVKHSDVDADNSGGVNSQVGAVLEISGITRGSHGIKVTRKTGSTKIIGTYYDDSITSGIHVSMLAEQGINPGSMDDTPAAITDPILAAIDPDLCIYYEYNTTTAAAQQSVYDLVMSGVPDADWLSIIPHEDQGNTTETQIPGFVDFARDNGTALYNSRNLFGSYAAAYARGFVPLDGVHLIGSNTSPGTSGVEYLYSGVFTWLKECYRNDVLNATASTSIPAAIVLPYYDTDVASLMDRMESHSVYQSDAVKYATHNFVSTLKLGGLWNKLAAFYPHLGGLDTNASAANQLLACKYNLKGTSYDITWNGTMTVGEDGVKGNGTTGYGNTGIIANTAMTLAGGGLGYFHSDTTATASSTGSYDSVMIGNDGAIWEENTGGDGQYTKGLHFPGTAIPGKTFSHPNLQGTCILYRLSTTSQKLLLRREEANIALTTVTAYTATSRSANPVLINAQNNAGTPRYFKNTRYMGCHFALADSWTDEQIEVLADAVEVYMTAIGRKPY
jgi:hypothetical protein